MSVIDNYILRMSLVGLSRVTATTRHLLNLRDVTVYFQAADLTRDPQLVSNFRCAASGGAVHNPTFRSYYASLADPILKLSKCHAKFQWTYSRNCTALELEPALPAGPSLSLQLDK